MADWDQDKASRVVYQHATQQCRGRVKSFLSIAGGGDSPQHPNNINSGLGRASDDPS